MDYPQLVEPALILNIRTAVNSLKISLRQPTSVKRQVILSRASWELRTVQNRANALLEWTLAAKSQGFKDKGMGFSFAQINLNESQRDEFELWLKEQPQDIVENISKFALDGYKLSLSCDFENQCFIASFTQRNIDHPHNSVTVSSRSDDWDEAMMLCAFKVYRLFPGKPLPTERKKFNWG
jgi:hypothetical protein